MKPSRNCRKSFQSFSAASGGEKSQTVFAKQFFFAETQECTKGGVYEKWLSLQVLNHDPIGLALKAIRKSWLSNGPFPPRAPVKLARLLMQGKNVFEPYIYVYICLNVYIFLSARASQTISDTRQMQCGIIEVGSIEDAVGCPCGNDVVARCLDCGTHLCDAHAEHCDLCNQVFCSMCLAFHRREQHQKKPATVQEQHRKSA